MYGFWIAAGLIVFFCTFTWRTTHIVKQANTSLMVMAIASVLAIVAAKLFYVILLADSTLAVDGIEALFFTDADSFSDFGGAAGALLGAWISAKIVKIQPAVMLDFFVPCGALCLAFFRAGEIELGTIGVGTYVDPQSVMARFPFSVTNAYGEHYYAVFLLEALLALLCGIVLLFVKRWPQGIKAETGLFFLALGQVFCESLRARCMKWGFVRIEQLLCGLLLLALLWLACKKMTGIRPYRYVPLLMGFLCVAGIGLLEFALDKSDIPVWLCYCLFLVDLVGLGLMEAYAVRNRAASAKLRPGPQALFP